MEWIFIEALFALAVGIAIVWWTMAPRRKSPRAGDTNSGAGSEAGSGDAKSGVAEKEKS